MRRTFLLMFLAMSLLPGAHRAEAAEPASRPKSGKLIEFGWDEPDTTFLRKHNFSLPPRRACLLAISKQP